ncbi:hypothetical protein PCE1_004171 [Barthelona sp. PCE]
MHSFLLTFIFCILAVCVALDPTAIDSVIQQYIDKRVTPGAAWSVAHYDKNNKLVTVQSAQGSFTYGEPAPRNPGQNPPMTIDTIFDMASVTKVSMTTTAIAQLYEKGYFDVTTPVYKILPEFGDNGKASITIENCLLHNAGFYPDPVPEFWSNTFACPQVVNKDPSMVYTCQDKIYNAVMHMKLKWRPGEVFKYSDISMMTMAFVVGQVAKENNLVSSSDFREGCTSNLLCYYEAYVRKYIIEFLSMERSALQIDPAFYKYTAPTWYYTFRGQMQGPVSDGNAFVAGGWLGHAGFFTTAREITKLLVDLNGQHRLFNKTTLDFFIRRRNEPAGSSRALGWDTSTVGGTCGELGNHDTTTFLHLGYTGTQICCSPKYRICTSLLTNRVYPKDRGSVNGLRRAFNTAVFNQLFT